MQNMSGVDACTALASVPFIIPHNYGISEDFLGLDHYYGIHVPPRLNFVSVLGLGVLGYLQGNKQPASQKVIASAVLSK